jgi:uncharacterized membrane protein
MKKLLLAAFILGLSAQVAATTIGDESIVVDLEDSSVQKQIEVKELTSSSLTISTPAEISNLNVRVDGEPAQCDVSQTAFESRIECDISKRNNFSVELNFTADNLVERETNRNVFTYTRNFIRPTESFNLKVILPEGSGIVDDMNTSSPSLSPATDNIGSNGRRITVEWSGDPTIGESQSYRIVYERLSDQNNLMTMILTAVALIVVIVAVFLGYNRFRREDLENVYDELEEDHIEVLDLLAENDGSMLQKDVVDSLDYSKAKISSTVSDLVDDEIVSKEKEGRSNKLKLSKKYKT